MRIFIAAGIFHPDSGGPATYLYRLIPELQARGHSVRVVTFGEPNPAVDYPYPLTRISLRQGLIARQRAYLAAYRAEIAQADLIYINSLSLPRSGDRRYPRVLKIVGDHAWERAVNRGWIAPDTDIDTFQRARQGGRYGLLVEWLKIARAREACNVDRVIVPSHYLRDMVIGWGAPPERVQVIYNALDTQHYAPSLSRVEARAALTLDPNALYLLTAARLTAWKGVDYLIDALAQCSSYHLLIAGEGPQLEALKAQAARLAISDRVHFLGKVPHEKLPLYMRAADYFALYSGYEGLSHTLLESLYAGTPVIASARGGNPEVVRDGVNGLLAKHPDLAALVATLERAAAPELRAKLTAGVTYGLDRFAWPALVEQTIGTLTDAAQKYKSAAR